MAQPYTITRYTPTKRNIQGPTRMLQPSPEKTAQIYNSTSISPLKRPADSGSGSPAKKTHLRQASSVSTQDTADILRAVASSKHISLSFNLIDDEGHYNVDLTIEMFDELIPLFDGVTSIHLAPPLLVFKVKALPPKPWPLTVAGLPVYITTSDFDFGIDRGRSGKGRVSALMDPNLRVEKFDPSLLRVAANFLLDIVGVKISSITFLGLFFQIIIPDNTSLTELPSHIFHLPCGYLFASEAPKSLPTAKRQIIPAGTVWDNARYDQRPLVLRPGVMIGAKSFGSSEPPCLRRNATLGVGVKDNQGSTYVTIATHVLDDSNSSNIFHPSHDLVSDPVGTVRITLVDIDISLVELASDLQYVNETFAARAHGEEIPATVITRIRTAPLNLAVHVTMNNPYMGHCDGIVLGTGIDIVDDIGGRRTMVDYQWLTFQNGDRPVSGCSGSAVLDESGDLVGLFQYVVLDEKSEHMALAKSISAQELTKRGYEIAA